MVELGPPKLHVTYVTALHKRGLVESSAGIGMIITSPVLAKSRTPSCLTFGAREPCLESYGYDLIGHFLAVPLSLTWHNECKSPMSPLSNLLAAARIVHASQHN